MEKVLHCTCLVYQSLHPLLLSWRCNARSTRCQDCYSPLGNDALLWWLYWTRKGWFRLHCPPTEAHMENLSSCSLPVFSASLWYQDNANGDMKWTTKTVWIVTMCSGDWSVWELDGSREGLLFRHGVDGTGVIMKAGTENMFKWSYTGLHMTGVMLAVELLMCMVQNFFTCFYDV